MKCRIVKVWHTHYKEIEVRYRVERKFLWWWTYDFRFDSFKTFEEAKALYDRYTGEFKKIVIPQNTQQ